MSPWILYALSGVVVMAAALYGLFSTGYLLRKVIATNLVGSGVFLFLVALARRSSSGIPDPVPHALVLTGIVVSVSATALALSLARRLGGAAEDAPGPPASAETEADEP
ncbi:sodium:proton antiporter [Sorangium sp. So ce1335]|uniref:sodium:proton antiporter n=1 Tax=Sorangium sp. So ce1335 TaxID=3133335 RepID=UPI003F61D73A